MLTSQQDRRRLRFRMEAIDDSALDFTLGEDGFSMAASSCDPVRLNIPHRSPSHQPDVTLHDYADLLRRSLKIGFRLAEPGHDQPTLRLDRTSRYDWMFKTVFSSNDDEVIADAVCAWIADSHITLPGLFAQYFTKRVEKGAPFSRRLRWASTRVIERIWRSEIEASGLEGFRLLNYLEVDADEVVDEDKWGKLLTSAIRSPKGLENLSSHYWRLLDKLVPTTRLYRSFVSRDVEVMKLLEEAEDWEKLEVWMVVIWMSLSQDTRPTPASMRDVKRANRELLSKRPSALPRFNDLVLAHRSDKDELERICSKAQSTRAAASGIHAVAVSFCLHCSVPICSDATLFYFR